MTEGMTIQPVTYADPAAYAAPNGYQLAGFLPQGLSVMVHGYPKMGKSSFADSGPRPVLILDVETTSIWTPSRKITWNPLRQSVPVWDGTWDTCVVTVTDIKTLYTVHEILARGQHPFNSVSMDSVTEIQQRIMWAEAGARKLDWEDWGVVLRNINALMRQFRDLLTNPVKRVWSITYVCGTHFDNKTKKWRPLLQGASQDYSPYVPDITGWLYTADDGSRQLWIGPSKDYETGERIWGRLPHGMQLGYPGVVPGWTLETMVETVLTGSR